MKKGLCGAALLETKILLASWTTGTKLPCPPNSWNSKVSRRSRPSKTSWFWVRRAWSLKGKASSFCPCWRSTFESPIRWSSSSLCTTNATTRLHFSCRTSVSRSTSQSGSNLSIRTSLWTHPSSSASESSAFTPWSPSGPNSSDSSSSATSFRPQSEQSWPTDWCRRSSSSTTPTTRKSMKCRPKRCGSSRSSE